MSDWMEQISPSVNKGKVKKKNIKKSLYRENKEYPHTTINGKGHVARVYNKKGQ